MADPVTASIMVGTMLAGSAVQANQQKQQMKEVNRQAEEKQAKTEKDLADRKTLEETQAINEANQSQSNARRRALRNNYNRSTILTSPLGVVGEPQTSGKTLLGA